MSLNIDCPRCNKVFHDMESFSYHTYECLFIPQDKLFCKPTKWTRFCNWFWSLDWGFILGGAGGIYINSFFYPYICENYSGLTCISEGLAFGFLLGGLLRR